MRSDRLSDTVSPQTSQASFKQRMTKINMKENKYFKSYFTENV